MTRTSMNEYVNEYVNDSLIHMSFSCVTLGPCLKQGDVLMYLPHTDESYI